MIILIWLAVIAAFVSHAHAVDVSFNRQSACGYVGVTDFPTVSTVSTPNFPLLYSPTASCLWSFTTSSDLFMIVKCAGWIPCTDSFTFVSATGTNTTFCGATNAILVTPGTAVNITLKPSSTSTGGVVLCQIVALRSPITTRFPTTSVMTTKPSLTTPVLTTPHSPTTPSRATPVTTPPAPTSKPTIRTTPATSGPSSNCTCGIQGPAPNRIVGGSPAGQMQFPWMVLLVKNSTNTFCGGSIIAPGWVLTAAHCFKGFNLTNTRVTAYAGSYSSKSSSPTEQSREAVQLFQHPLYNNSTKDSDIALLKFATSFTFGPAVSPICLPLAYPTFDFANQTGVASGWGATVSGGTMNDILLQATLPILSTSQCRQQNAAFSQISNNIICTYAPGRDICQGDSGGPLMWVDPVSKRTLVAGIASFGVGCAGGYPSGFTKVNNYLSWIQTITGEKFCSP